MSGRRARGGLRGVVLPLLAAAVASAPPSGAAEAGARVTAVTGDAGVRGAPLRRDAAVADGERVRTGRDGACSLLVDGAAVLEICQGTSLRLAPRGAEGGPRVLELESGEIRVVAAPRAEAQRVEVRTPAAVATLFGAVAYVAVDASGATTIAAAESAVRVEPADRSGAALDLAAGKQVTLRPGAALPKAASAWNPDTSPADGCLVDFKAIAFEAARGR